LLTKETFMKHSLIAFAATLFIAAAPLQAGAADATKPAVEKKLTASQQRMVDCNKEATGKKGAERKAFMSQCLKAGAAPVADAKMPQQNKMKDCNKQAGEKALMGPDRKAFMSECLKAK